MARMKGNREELRERAVRTPRVRGNFRKDILPNEGSWVSGLQVEGEVLGWGGGSGGCWQLAPEAGNWATHLQCLLAERQGTS